MAGFWPTFRAHVFKVCNLAWSQDGELISTHGYWAVLGAADFTVGCDERMMVFYTSW